MFKKTLSLLTGTPVQNKNDKRRLTERELIEREARVGGELFGPIAAGHRREFFCLDERTWVWHEEWNDADGRRHVTSTRYEIHDNGVLKAQDGKVYRFIEGEELRNFVVAVRLYYETTAQDIYHKDPNTGRSLVQGVAATI